MIYVKIISKFLNIYCYEDPSISKISRLTSYFTSISGMMAFSALFKTSENRSSGVLGRINPYLILLPFLVVIPFTALMTYLLSKPKASKSELTKEKAELVKAELSKKPFPRKLIVGYVFAFLLSAFFMTSILIVAATNDETETNSWLIDFGVIMFQDLLILPIVTILL